MNLPPKLNILTVRTLLIVAGVALFSFNHAAADDPIIADHDCTRLLRIPTCRIEQAKTQFKMSYGHTSHGSQIISGMNLIKDPPGSLYWWDYAGTLGGLSLHDGTPPGDLGNPDYYTWEALTRTMLDTPGNDRNCVMWSWCGQADTTPANIQIYLDLMSGLIADYPDVAFIYMTGHLVGTGEEGNLHQRNNQIRDHVIATGGVLFDFADIESYDPDGNYFLDLYANDNCDYTGGNWAIEWCDANPGSELCAPCSCAHSQPLNCNLKARAFWWMMAELAAWDGQPQADFDCDDDVDSDDFDAFEACFTGPGSPYETGCGQVDFDFDDDVDCDDWTQFKLAWTAGGNPPPLPQCPDQYEPVGPGPERGGPDCQAGVKTCHDLGGAGSATSCSTDADCPPGEFCWDDCWGDWRGANCVVYDQVTGAARCYIAKNRYLTIDPTVNDGPVAYHVTLSQLDDQYDHSCLPLAGWLSSPVCRADDTGCPVAPQPPSTDPCQGEGMFGWVSYLTPNPVTPRIWNEYPLFVAGREVAPAASYEIRASTDGIIPIDPPLTIMTSHDPNGDAQHWGDVTSDPGTSIPWMPPEFTTSFSDVSAAIRTFENTGGPALEWSDVEIDHVVTFGDIGFLIKAFEGDTYPGITDIEGGCVDEAPRPLIGLEPCP